MYFRIVAHRIVVKRFHDKEQKERILTVALSSSQVEAMLRKQGAIEDGHFVFTSGAHSNFYIDCASVLRDPVATLKLAQSMGQRVVGVKPDIIVTPAENAVPLGIPAAHFLCHSGDVANVRAIVASKASDDPNTGEKRFAFKRGGDKELNGKRVAILEDLWSTGSSTRAVVRAVRECGGDVVAVGAIVNRGKVTERDVGGDVGDFFSLLEVDGVPHMPSDDSPCPWCTAGVPMRTDYGHGKPWCEQHPEFPRAA